MAIVTTLACFARDPTTGASVDSPAFLRAVAEMSADTAGSGAGHDVGGAVGVKGDTGPDGGATGTGEQGVSVAAIDDAEAFHLKTASQRCGVGRGYCTTWSTWP